MLNAYRKYFYQMLFVFSTLFMGAYGTSYAGIISTTDIVEVKQVQLDREYLTEALARDDVKLLLKLEGVDADAAEARVASMTNSEVQMLAAKMDQLPVGAGLSTTEWLLVIIIVIILL